MKKSLTALLLAGIMASSAGLSAQEQLAFPGAEGFGRYALGARAVANPEIYHVTNLNDAGPGSLRDAVSKEGRIVVFDVSGVIKIKSPLVFKGKNTILGHTAPGEGVQVYGNRVSFSGASNLIVRHMRFRMGKGGDSGKDACGIADGNNMIFDHISAMWGRDETFSISGSEAKNITIQNSIMAQGLMPHSAGGLIQTDGGITLYRNLYIDNNTRNNKVKGLNQYVNNVVYNWSNGAYIMGDTEGASWAHIENNYFINGRWGGSKPFTRGTAAFHYYGPGNYHDSNKNGLLDGFLLDEAGTNGNQSDGQKSTWVDGFEALNNCVIHEVIHGDKENPSKITSEKDRTIPQPIPVISNIMTAKDAVDWIVANVGPVLPVRDEVDQYLINDLSSFGLKGTRSGIYDETSLPHKGTGNLSGGVKPLDTDKDGIPDAWETANGLNPNDAADAVTVAANGYLNIENYANQISEPYPYIKKPVKFAVGEPTKTEVSFSWELNGNTENGFVVELSTDGTTFTEKATPAAGDNTGTITGLQPTTKYWIRLRATDGKGLYSDYTPTLEFETMGDPTVPAASINPFPANSGKEGIAGGLTLTWENNVKAYAGALTYDVWIGTDKAALTKMASGLTATEWDASKAVETGKTYYWRVDATNSLGTTQSEVWSFSTTAGGVLFYTDFYKQPQEWFDTYGNITANTNIINAENTTKDVAGMTFGAGETAIRIIAMDGANNSDDTEKDYGPATADDAGATDRCVQFYTTAAGGYLLTPEVTGPCVITLYLGNPDGKSKTVKLATVTNGEEKPACDLALGGKKRVYKFTYTHTTSGPVRFKVDNNAKKFNINDILIERWIPSDGEQPLELTAGSLDNTDMSYADGTLSLTFNQDIVYNGNATIQGKTQWENISVAASGKKLNISYEALNVNSAYSVTLPEGSVTDITGKQKYSGTVKFSTGDFGPTKQTGETHFGKAAKTLPLNFAPFNTVAPFETVGALVQEKQNDYPHWVSASEEIAADYATMNKTSDKIMTYFDGKSAGVALEIEYIGTGNPRLKVQESRNCDVAPGWRTLRVLEKEDFPFRGELPLNPETRMVKLAPVSIGGSLKVKTFRIADANGFYGDDYQSGITSVNAADSALIIATADGITVTNIGDTTPVSVYDISGRTVAAGMGQSTFTLASGLYIVQIHGGKTVKVRI